MGGLRPLRRPVFSFVTGGIAVARQSKNAAKGHQRTADGRDTQQICSADEARNQQRRGVPNTEHKPAHGHAMAARADSDERARTREDVRADLAESTTDDFVAIPIRGRRIEIADALQHGKSLRQIAVGLGRSPSTVSR